jgi:hypothetical protein
MQREHTDLVILAAIAGHFAMAGEEDEIVGAVPLLDDVQALVDFAAEGLIVKVPAEEDGFDRPAKFGEGLVSRMLNVAPDEAAQNRFGFGRASRIAVTYLTIWSYCWRINSQSIGFVKIACRFG